MQGLEAAATTVKRAAERRQRRLRIVAVAGILLFSLITAWLIAGAQRAAAARDLASERRYHTVVVMLEAQRLLSALQDGELGQRGYLITGNSAYLAPYTAGRAAAPSSLDRLIQLTGDNARERAPVGELRRLAAERWRQLDGTVAAAQAGDISAAAAFVRSGAGKQTMTLIRSALRDIKLEEQRLLKIRQNAADDATASSRRYLLWLSLLGVVAFGIVAVTVAALLRARDRAIVGEALAESVAQLRASRDFLQAVIDGSSDPIHAKDLEGRFVLVNRRVAHAFGVEPEAMIGKRDHDFTDPQIADKFAGMDRAVIATGEPQIAEEEVVNHGERRVYHSVKTPWFENGAIVGTIGISRDITDRKRAEEALQLSNDQLEMRIAARTAELQRALDGLQTEVRQRAAVEAQVRQLQKAESIGQLTGGIAHDFNNMLSIVIGSLDLAKRRLRGDEDPKVAMLIGNAEEGATRAAALTARLLAFARQQPLAPEPIDTNQLVGTVSELLRRTLGELQIETVLAGGLWRSYADAAQLENALVNLAVNARDAMPDGGKLTIETANSHLDDAYAQTNPDVVPGQYVVICVSDTGSGMPPEVIERAFDPFYTTKAVGKGTGLGLSQVFGYAKQSGGHVKIYSEVGHGTTVKIYLPRYFGAGEAVPKRIAADIAGGSADEVLLVVEDDPKVLGMSSEMLRELGYTVLIAGSAKVALELLGSRPDVTLLFTDIVMPHMNGRKLAEAAVLLRPDLRILYTTGYTRNAVVHNGMLDFGVAFLPKPYTYEQMARKVRAVLDGDGVNRAEPK